MSEDSILTDRSTNVVSYSIQIGGNEIVGTWDVLSITIFKEINKITKAKIVISDGSVAEQDFKASNSEDFVPGNEVTIEVGYHSDNTKVFSGILVKHGIKIRPGRRSVLEIECCDKAVVMTSMRKSACYSAKTDSDVITEVIENNSIGANVESVSFEHPEIVQYNCTDWDFVLSRADNNGFVVVNNEGELTVGPPDLESAPVAPLTFGASLLEFEAEMDARNQYASATAYSWDFVSQEVSEEEGEAPSFDSTGNLSVDDLSSVVNSEGYKLYHGGQLQTDELINWAKGKLLKSYLSKIRGRAKIKGFADVEPNTLVTLNGVGERFNGDAYVSGVLHQIYQGTWTMDIQLGMSPEWFSKKDNIQDRPGGGLVPGIDGLHIAKVVQVEDDEQGGNHRILVKIPYIEADGGTDSPGIWARLSTLFAGAERGSVFRPEVDDEVVLGFIAGDPRNPVILGALHSNDVAAPIESTAENNEKGFYTKGGMKITFDDDAKIILMETESGNKLTLDEEEGGILVEDENGNSIQLNSDGITITSAKDIIMEASGDIKAKGVNIESTASAEFKAEGSAGSTVSSSATLTLEGGLVMIN